MCSSEIRDASIFYRCRLRKRYPLRTGRSKCQPQLGSGSLPKNGTHCDDRKDGTYDPQAVKRAKD